jgi:F-type H+-transporting ATPase subunit delta
MARFRALPYAKALHQVIAAADPGRADEVTGQLERVAEALEAVPEFQRVLTTPMVAVETKRRILDEVLDSLEIDQPTRRFIHVVQQHYRMEHMRHISEVYRELIDRSLGRTRATVEVAGAIAEAERRQILDVMIEVIQTEVVADFEENADLLAGFRVRVGSKVFDGSLVAQVDRLSREALRE